ncbi:GntR family transcriptional regulator [Luteococcus peritonei]|uniref:GntR family transcriptional regulator n=1 Tax=Luteococcus peritonei TaxID=88874 RepID=A0ABW4RY33_9ACTN
MPTTPPAALEIDRGSAMPFYHQLKHILLVRMEAEGLAGGDRFWSDHELCARYGLSRSVVRQALSELESEGVVERTRGKGTFVVPRKTEHGLARTAGGLFDVAAARGLRLTSRVLRQEVVPASDVVGANLAVDPGEPVVVIERVRSLEGEPCVRTSTWLPLRRVPGLEAVDLTDDSLYRVLREQYGIAFGGASRSVEAAAASSETASLLGLSQGAPILLLRSTQRDAEGEPIETYVAHHRGDRSRFDLEIGAAVESATVQIS